MASTSTLVDRVKIVVQSSGTGPFQLGRAVKAYRGVEALQDGATYSYAVESGAQYEVGTCRYVASSGSVIRTPQISSNGRASVSFPANVELNFTALAQDIFPIVQSTGSDPAVAMSQKATTDAVDAAVTFATETVTALVADKADKTPATQSAPGLMPITDKIKSDGIVNLKADFGARFDGLTNDSARLQDAADALQDGRTNNRGGRIDLGHYGKLLLADGAFIPRNVQIVGQFDPQKPRTRWDFLNTCPSAIILPSGKSLVMDGSSIRNVLLWQGNIMQDPQTPEAFYEELAKFAGDAIVASGDDPYVMNCMAIGFDWFARFNNVFNPTATGNIFDCNNGIEVTQCLEFGPWGISYNQGRGVYTQFRPWPWAVTRRPGKAIYMHDTVDFVKCWGNVSYGYDTGLHLKNVASITANHQADGPAIHTAESAAASVGTRGIWLEGNISNSKLVGCHVDGQDFGYVLDTVATPVLMEANSAGYCMSNHIVLGGGSFGNLGSMTLNGGGPYDPGNGIDRRIGLPITSAAGVGRWSGDIILTGDSKSGSALYTEGAVELNNIRGIKRTQINGSFFDPHGSLWTGTFAQTVTYPNARPGDRAIITDSNTSTYGATIGGGGSSSVLSTFFNGAWIVA